MSRRDERTQAAAVLYMLDWIVFLCLSERLMLCAWVICEILPRLISSTMMDFSCGGIVKVTLGGERGTGSAAIRLDLELRYRDLVNDAECVETRPVHMVRCTVV